MQKSPVLAGPLQDCERLALEGDRARELAIRKPASQAMGEGALRSFYRRTAALAWISTARDSPNRRTAK